MSIGFPRPVAALSILAAGMPAPASAGAQPGYAQYTAWEDWARLRVRTQTGLASSFDRSGGNDDFSHYEWPTGLVIDEVAATVRTIEGPGVIYRFWMPHATSDLGFVVRMFFDGEPTPRIDTTSDVLLNGAFGYFTAPLVDTFAGGQVCYEPIPFARSLRIETVNHQIPPDQWSRHRHYYQYGYVTLPYGSSVASYTGTLTPQQQAARAAVVDLWANAGQHPAGSSPSAIRLTIPAGSVPAGGSLTLADLTGPGVVRQFSLGMDSPTDDELDGLHIQITYDGEASPAIDVAVADFWGAGHQRALYRSLPLGTDSPDGCYCYWPMPFRKALLVGLANTTGASIAIDAAVVEYEPGPVATDMCYLHAQSVTGVRAPGQIYHPMLNATGRGHYVGNLLYVQQDAYSFYMLEGDDVIVVDGADSLDGTGLEDAYNGGYYYNWVLSQAEEPEGAAPQSASRPLNGILYVHRETGVEYARADQYRWLIADRVGFTTSIEVKIENRHGVVGSEWTSVAFWYQQPPIEGDTDADGDLDLADFRSFQQCFTAPTPACLELFDFDAGGSVDLTDLQALVSAFTGPW